MAEAKKFKKADDKKLSYSELVAKRNDLKKQYMDFRFPPFPDGNGPCR